MNGVDMRVPKTKEEKKAAKALKAFEKQKRVEKSLIKSTSSTAVESVVNNQLTKQLEKSNIQNVSDKNFNKVESKTEKTIPTKGTEFVAQCSSAKNSVKLTESAPVAKAVKQSNKKKESEFKSFHRPSEVKSVPCFKHLFYPDRRGNFNEFIDKIPDAVIHPKIKELGQKIDSFVIRGATNKSLEFFEALKIVIKDFSITNEGSFATSFSKALDNYIDFLGKCRPLGVTMNAAVQYLKMHLSQAHSLSNEECRDSVLKAVELFISDRITASQESIQSSVAEFFKTASTILIFSYSRLVCESIIQFWKKEKSNISSFKVYIVDSFLDKEGEKATEFLKKDGVPHFLINLSDVPKVMPVVDIVVLGATSVMSNGNVVSGSGSASVAYTAKYYKKMVVICSETYKFSVENQCNAFEWNDLRNPEILVKEMSGDCSKKCNGSSEESLKNWRGLKSNITVCDPLYDVISANYIDAICCELNIISPTAVSHVTRTKQFY